VHPDCLLPGTFCKNGAGENSAALEILGIIGKAPSISQAVLSPVTWPFVNKLFVRADDTPTPNFLLGEIVCRFVFIGKMPGCRFRLAVLPAFAALGYADYDEHGIKNVAQGRKNSHEHNSRN